MKLCSDLRWMITALSCAFCPPSATTTEVAFSTDLGRLGTFYRPSLYSRALPPPAFCPLLFDDKQRVFHDRRNFEDHCLALLVFESRGDEPAFPEVPSPPEYAARPEDRGYPPSPFTFAPRTFEFLIRRIGQIHPRTPESFMWGEHCRAAHPPDQIFPKKQQIFPKPILVASERRTFPLRRTPVPWRHGLPARRFFSALSAAGLTRIVAMSEFFSDLNASSS